MGQLDRFLVFAFSHQIVIIEIIFALILSIVIIWLFSHLRQESGSGDAGFQNVDEIEAALRRVLDSSNRPTTASEISRLINDDVHDGGQALDGLTTNPLVKTTGAALTTSGEIAVSPRSASGGAAASGAAAAAMPAAGVAELERLKNENEIRTKKLQELEQSLAVAKSELARAQEQAAQKQAATAAPTADGANTDELQAKIKSLESKLDEYQIIEDDIANLSLYKEENQRLKSEMDKLRDPKAASSRAEAARDDSAAAASPATPKPAVPPPQTATSEAAAAVTVRAVAQAGAESGLSDVALAMQMTTAMSEQDSPPTPAAPINTAGAAPIDGEKLIKEFDGMVKAPPVTSAPQTGDDRDASQKLIEEFENFMKGSGG